MGMRTDVVESRCIARWEDSHQIHSEEIIIEWGYQAAKTTMKKLVHCMRLTVVGPVDIGMIGRDYVNHCIDYGINNDRTRHVLELLISVILDVYGGGGALTAAKLTDYVRSVSHETISCLSNTHQLQDFAQSELQNAFNGSLQEESHWEYWEL